MNENNFYMINKTTLSNYLNWLKKEQEKANSEALKHFEKNNTEMADLCMREKMAFSRAISRLKKLLE